MAKGKKRPERAIVDELFSHHLGYELWMLDVESFHLHARNVHEFFTLNSNCKIDPRWFATGFEVNKGFMNDELVKKINQQMAHLTAKRIIGEGQLDQTHWKEIKDSIDAEVRRFESTLTPEYKSIWRKPRSISAGDGGASSLPTAIKTTTLTPPVGKLTK
ncbi:hypothetical protein [Bradyrhizobium sp. BRP23]|uniref:hypothetical protein n=1 Tax=Bradyrhizobium sp. BRP23 TaxID=2793820 RepID=UPI001CD430BC|nr:hypothetical protein [Bradyrhizobium sp. BRP23]MCA1382713.1 hypothetical protein [Bradyrhizobium sp. BRP05]MCA1421819.1 hypothetical protein [Bradyrhizobium sp. BRP23]